MKKRKTRSVRSKRPAAGSRAAKIKRRPAAAGRRAGGRAAGPRKGAPRRAGARALRRRRRHPAVRVGGSRVRGRSYAQAYNEAFNQAYNEAFSVGMEQGIKDGQPPPG
ncbi:hypothetical protein SAMN02799630_02762 [Paenibacillus sp. UNCCL117]|uniref:hypothetical protein n=1 Tax=unclassified Paenibacillus TaxID=185978 RepID=UPI0008900257|nr:MULTISPECIES: hypothetical protein [unclassified Paenibacillus]SDD30364.1 hypothetical protein SAMN04488602_107205 [Paenibacillus sp. cl123]SFW40358.1 hypothetical protein SAMN02799630_02762 [Paenibacillus sp. UNCCL117]